LDSIHQFPQKLDASSTSAKVSGIFIGLVTWHCRYFKTICGDCYRVPI
jgi:hypothetical protein